MNKSDLLKKAVQRSKLPKSRTTIIFDAFFESLAQALADGYRIDIRGFGTFASKTYRARVGRHPQTGNIVWVSGKRRAYFKASKELRARVDAEADEEHQADRSCSTYQ